MPSARLVFVVPEDHAEIAEVLLEHGAEGDLYGVDTADGIAAHLAGRVGETVGVDFDSDEPDEPVLDMMKALDDVQAPYWGCYDGFEERSRGMRAPPRVYYNLTGEDRREIKMFWEDGPPVLDARTLRAAGLPQATVDEIEGRFFASAAAPKP